MSLSLPFPTRTGPHDLGSHTHLDVSGTEAEGWTAELVPARTGALTLADLLADIGLGEPFWPDSVSVTDLAVRFVPASGAEPGRVSAALGLGTSCALVGGLSLEAVSVFFTHTNPDAQATPPTGSQLEAAISAELAFGAGTLSIEGDFQSSRGVSVLALATELESPIALGGLLGDLLGRVGLSFALPDAIADCMLTGGRMSLTVTSTAAAPATASTPAIAATRRVVFQLRCSIGRSGRTWEIIPGLLELGAGSLVLTVDNGIVTLDVQDWVEICGAGWTVDVQVPSLAGLARLGPSSSATGDHRLAAFLDHFGLHDPGGLADMKLKWAVVQFNGTARRAAVHLELSDAWQSEHFSVRDVKIDVAYQGGAGGGASGALSAELVIASVTMFVSASHPGPGQGWAFEGAVTFTDPLTIKGAADAFGVGADVAGLGSLAEVGLVSLDLSYATLSGALHLGCVAKINDHAMLHLALDVSRGVAASEGHAAAKDVRFSGYLEIRGARFDLAFEHNGTGTLLVGAWVAAAGSPLTLADLIAALGGVAPAELPAVTLSRAVVAWERDAAVAAHGATSGGTAAPPAATMMFAADLDIAIDFSGLRTIPLVGEHLPANLSFGAALSPTVLVSPTAATFSTSDVKRLVPTAAAGLPDTIARGVNPRIQVRIGDTRWPVELPAGAAAPTRPALATAAPPGAPAASLPAPDTLTWIPVQKTLGNFISLRRVGVGFASPKLTLMVDGSITVQALTLDLLGLGLTYDTRDHSVAFAFRGVGFSLVKEPLRISAAFMNVGGDFVGRAQVVTSKFGLSAIGGFTMVGGSPSLFLYGILDYPIGGPAFFFIEGLAAGFGVNRHLSIPTVDQVDVFPLVVDAMNPPSTLPQAAGADAAAAIGAQMERLHSYITPARGEYFFAAGVKFNSFRILDGFVLALVSLDTTRDTFRVDVVGTATWSTPPRAAPADALGWIRLNLIASFCPAEGSLMIQAQLSPECFVLSQACHIHGGVAAAFWFSGAHSGDFVVSVGGYHPDFKVPAHYPAVARLGLDWQVSSSVHASGSLYFALTPNALMFGFEFQATWQVDPLSAWFDLGLDFLMQFKPLHYDARGHIEIGASFHTFFGSITVSAGASLHIWGPAFSGTADAHLGPFSVSLSFGADAAAPASLHWDEFKTSFLPDALEAKAVSIVVTDGLLSTLDVPDGAKKGTWWKINAKHFALAAESLLPVTEPRPEWPVGGTAPALAVAPMGHAVWSGSSLSVTVTRDRDDASDDFTFGRIEKTFPTAVWGAADSSDRLVPATGGLTVRPSPKDRVEMSGDIPRGKLAYEVHGAARGRAASGRLFDDLPSRSAAHRALDREELRTLTGDPNVARAREAVLITLASALSARELDPARAVCHGPDLADCFLYAPHVSRRASA